MGNIKPNLATESGMPPDSDVIQAGVTPMGEKAQKPHVVPGPDQQSDSPVDSKQQSATATAMPELTPDAPQSIAKPKGSGLDKFKSKRASAVANVETLQTTLPIHSIKEAKDFVRLHPKDDEYWSDELCFVNVPIKGQKRDLLHLIEEELAMANLPSARIMRCRLALATKPYDKFFLCQVPSRNLENDYNSTNLAGCEQAKRLWTQVTSRREEGVEAYKVDKARDPDAFPDPKWPAQTMDELITGTFGADRMIDSEDHPALKRLIGARLTS